MQTTQISCLHYPELGYKNERIFPEDLRNVLIFNIFVCVIGNIIKQWIESRSIRLGKVEFLWHKHVVFRNPDACIGCKKCIKTCPQGVFFVPDDNYKVPSLWQRIKSKISVESLLPLLLLATIVTGIKLHVAGHVAVQAVWHGWLVSHVVSTIIFTIFTIWHIAKRKK